MSYYPYPYMSGMNYNGNLQGTFDQRYSTFSLASQGYRQPYLTTATPTFPTLSEPSVKCGIDGCVATLPVERNRASLAYHLLFVHGYLLGDAETVCGWKDAGDLQVNGAVQPCQWHGKGDNILDHIVNSHLGFVDLCSKCGSGPFSRKSSRDRHESSCQGRVPARCRDCLREFPSIIALGGHAELGLCRPAS